MSARWQRGGRRPGAGRPKGTGGPAERVRRNRVVVKLTDSEIAALKSRAARLDLPLGTLAHRAVVAFLDRGDKRTR